MSGGKRFVPIQILHYDEIGKVLSLMTAIVWNIESEKIETMCGGIETG